MVDPKPFGSIGLGVGLISLSLIIPYYIWFAITGSLHYYDYSWQIYTNFFACISSIIGLALSTVGIRSNLGIMGLCSSGLTLVLSQIAMLTPIIMC